MKPARIPRGTDKSLVKNTLSIHRRAISEFNMNKNPRIVKDSPRYKMIKYGPLPKGDFTYLIRNGKVTIHARWLIYAADLEFSFMELCIVARLIQALRIFKRGSGRVPNTPGIFRKHYLLDEFNHYFKDQTIYNALTRLTNKGYVLNEYRRFIIRATDYAEERLQNMMGDDLAELIDYVEVELQIV